MIPNPIRKVLSTMAARQVRARLMGGQACVFYGAAEFSRDADLAILGDEDNLRCLRHALADLQAEGVAVPPFERQFLQRGHAVHFRCQHPEAKGLRVDVMSVMRGVDAFPILWGRRTTVEDADGTSFELLSLPDLVQAKKTQRDKDWPMIRRLLEADYAAGAQQVPTRQRREFWLREMRTCELLIEVAETNPDVAQDFLHHRPLLAQALSNRRTELEDALVEEEKAERERDRVYWRPLKAELEKLRRIELQK